MEKIQQAIDYIEDNLDNDITAQSIGAAVNYSASALKNYFGAITGYSISEYIRLRRLSVAAELLYGNMPVTQAAFISGYDSVEAFSKAFKRTFGLPPGKYARQGLQKFKFDRINIQLDIQGGFAMKRNIIPGLMKVDWSDKKKQNEFVASVISALNALGENLSYEYVCAVSGSSFRTSFSQPQYGMWNHGNYHVANTPIIIQHAFKMLGYEMRQHSAHDYLSCKSEIISAIDAGIPVITLQGVINCADACVISGYDNDGDVLLGYNPFMNISDDHDEEHDGTGYFRKSQWHSGWANGGGSILLIGKKTGAPRRDEIFAQTLKLIQKLIRSGNLVKGQYNGEAAHAAFARALQEYDWDDNFQPYLNVMCNYKQYLDRAFAAAFFSDNNRLDLASVYEEIYSIVKEMGNIIPQDFSAAEMFSDKRALLPYCAAIMRIRGLELRAAEMMDS